MKMLVKSNTGSFNIPSLQNKMEDKNIDEIGKQSI